MKEKTKNILFYIGIGLLVVSCVVGIILFGVKCTNIQPYEITWISYEFDDKYQTPLLRLKYKDENEEEHYVEKRRLNDLELYIVSLGIDEDFNCQSWRVFVLVETNKYRKSFNNMYGHYNWYLAVD